MVASPTIQTTTPSVEDMPYSKQFFDVVICKGVLQHCQYFTAGMRECLRVAKPGALIIVSFGYDLIHRKEELKQTNTPPVYDNIYDLFNVKIFLDAFIKDELIDDYNIVTINEGVAEKDGFKENSFICMHRH